MGINTGNRDESRGLEELIGIFSAHAEEYDKNFEESASRFKENNPGVALPPHFTNHFNLPRAIKLICREILEIKIKLKEKSS